MTEKDRSIENEDGVPIWVRADCECNVCNYLRKLEQNRKIKNIKIKGINTKGRKK